MTMFDIHTHILHGIDDGASDLEQMLLMARDAASQHITGVIATPHHADGHHWNPGERIRRLTDEANAALRAANIPLTIYPGQEVRIYNRLLEDLEEKIVLTLNDSRYLLLELPHSHIPRETADMIYELQLMGIVPIIAHPERNLEIARDPRRLLELVQTGALAQVTSHSIIGHSGKKVKQIAMDLCKHRLIHLMASDAHNRSLRNFNLDTACEAIVDTLGQDFRDYYTANACSVMNDQPIEVWPADARMRKKFFFFGR